MLAESFEKGEVSMHEVQCALVNLNRDREFERLINLEIPSLIQSLIDKLKLTENCFSAELLKNHEYYYLKISVLFLNKKMECFVLLNDSGPAFVIEAFNKKLSLLSAKRIRETLDETLIEQAQFH